MAELGQVAYEAYAQDAGWQSIHGEPLPQWDDQDIHIKWHWEAAAQAVVKATG